MDGLQLTPEVLSQSGDFYLVSSFPGGFFINFLFAYSLNFLLKKLGFSKSEETVWDPTQVRKIGR